MVHVPLLDFLIKVQWIIKHHGIIVFAVRLRTALRRPSLVLSGIPSPPLPGVVGAQIPVSRHMTPCGPPVLLGRYLAGRGGRLSVAKAGGEAFQSRCARTRTNMSSDGLIQRGHNESTRSYSTWSLFWFGQGAHYTGDCPS